MRTAIFFNFTDKPFTGYWNGRPHTFKAGEKKYMPQYLAEHFAKHLTNEILTSQEKYAYTSPKKPAEVPEFMNLFKKACIVSETEDDGDEAAMEIELANKSRPPLDGPSSEIRVKQAKPIDPYDASSQPADKLGSGAPQIIGEAGGDDDEFEDVPQNQDQQQDQTPAQDQKPAQPARQAAPQNRGSVIR